jgi:drug/metabolite transporter (DMT)-like permease
MTILILAISCSAFIFVLFRLFPKFGVDTFQAIVVNYFVACACGLIFYGKDWNTRFLENTHLQIFAMLVAILLISLFVLMGLSSQKNGVSMTSVAVKMSIALSVILMVVLYHEPVTVSKAGGVILALTGVLFISWPEKKPNEATATSSWWMLLVLFLGSGLLDFLLNYIQKNELGTLSPPIFSSLCFGLAGILGIMAWGVQPKAMKTPLQVKNAVAGIVLGIPNFFSIYLLLAAYQSTGWQDSVVLATINVSIVVLCTVIGLFAFKEELNRRKVMGIIAAIAAIMLLVSET